MHEIKWRVYNSLKPLKFMEVGLSRHKRYNNSDSNPVKRKSKRDKVNPVQEATCKPKMKEMLVKKGSAEARKRPTTVKANNAQSSLNEEILNLQKQLQDQSAVRHALENALNYQPLSHEAKIDESIPKPTKELIREITVLELEILNLERYLLTLYRKSYDPALVLPKSAQPSEQDLVAQQRGNEVNHSVGHFMSPRNSFGENVSEPEKLIDSSIHRSHSSLSQRSASSFRASPGKLLNKAVDSYHSLPLSMLEQAESATPNTSLAEHLGPCCSDHVPETPNSLSEAMIRCISAIYCELADPALTNQDYPSPIYEASSHGHSEKGGSVGRKIPLFNSYLDNPFQFEEGLFGPYFRMIKIQWICRDAEKLRDVESMLQKFRSLVYRLEDIDLRKLKHEEKLAFWINVHNSLVMHAFLVYGIPQNNLKRVSLVLKAAYNIGGHTISVDAIQNSILGCRLPRPGQWLRLLFSSKTRFKVGDARRAFSIEHPEPLLHFSLCSGSQSDPAVRVYTPKKVFEEMEMAREDYIRSNFIVQKDQKILLPKTVESFAKDSGLSTAYLVDMVEHLIPDSRRKFFNNHHQHHCQHKKSSKGIDWIPHNFAFQYLISKEAAW